MPELMIKQDAIETLEIFRNDYTREGSAIYRAIDIAIDALRQPTIEAEPVRRGRWIDKGEYAICTECGGHSGTQYDGLEPIALMSQFCPNCGAKIERR